MRDKTLKWMLVTLGLFNVIDCISTTVAIANGVAEGNAAMDAIIGTAWFPLVKLILVPLGLYLVWRVRSQTRRSILLAMTVPFVAYTLLTMWHIYGQFFI